MEVGLKKYRTLFIAEKLWSSFSYFGGYLRCFEKGKKSKEYVELEEEYNKPCISKDKYT